ncbi:MAG: 30S ribosomal protein S7 [Candidatus Woesebacteria bacterium GW2011_GWB1_38_5b]|uniref:Small ribosomal subunit protein uS7 n=1 Tax=Candidatus Woesebacteria bacterium GW2011_GWB1_38_5b TaxID=1618569 RepID=A0A0G0K547_9BACT|nr:MAG: 30S ribosomal protein S7 [Candidatus Woesebacteria bacterium GW2011_GWB1_38_5b]OGH47675.1 MAG: 30S ribosomal protein S7 [Candidatus Levybacteria bacterium RIFCSPLOWO2_01_FULL_39_10]
MRGNKFIKKRKVEEDPVYGSILVAKLINNIMRDGKKTVAQNVVYDAFKRLSEKDGSTSHSTLRDEPSGSDSKSSPQESALALFEKAVQNVGPRTEIKARRVGGASYQIPIEVRGDRRTALALRWIIEAARARSNKDFHTFSEKLEAEIIAAAAGEGEAIRKRDNTHRMAEANKAFSHFRI